MSTTNNNEAAESSHAYPESAPTPQASYAGRTATGKSPDQQAADASREPTRAQGGMPARTQGLAANVARDQIGQADCSIKASIIGDVPVNRSSDHVPVASNLTQAQQPAPSVEISASSPMTPAEPTMPPTHRDVATPQRLLQPQAGGLKPLCPPPPPTAAASPEEAPAKPIQASKSVDTQQPPFDVEEFVREVEEHARGAAVMREIKALEPQIRDLLPRVPMNAIHRGLKKRGLISCSHTRFGEVCRELFPDAVGKRQSR